MALKKKAAGKPAATKPAPRKPLAKKAASKKKPVAKAAAPKQAKKSVDTSEFPAVFARLKAILQPYSPGMVVVKDDASWYYLDTKFIGKNKKPLMFAAARVGKAYVSYYLMTIYMNTKWLAKLSPGLKKRMQGKACFNFTTVDEALFAELEALTKAGVEWIKNGGWDKFIDGS